MEMRNDGTCLYSMPNAIEWMEKNKFDREAARFIYLFISRPPRTKSLIKQWVRVNRGHAC